jgi:transcription antitermination factor NusG
MDHLHKFEDFDTSAWYAAYTRAHHEKQVASQLDHRSVEHFLPLYDSVRRWKDRRKKLQLPLFPGYIFVYLPLRERMRVLEVAGVVRLVGFNGVASPLPAVEIEALREGLSASSNANPHPYLRIGRRVAIKSGPLAGLEGILVRKKGIYRVVVSVDLLMRSIIVDVDTTDLAIHALNR